MTGALGASRGWVWLITRKGSLKPRETFPKLRVQLGVGLKKCCCYFYYCCFYSIETAFEVKVTSLMLDTQLSTV